ncbi:MAG TPA: hypothetical protein VIQ80_03280 [Candidatus Saccharimonadales bacterium]
MARGSGWPHAGATGATRSRRDDHAREDEGGRGARDGRRRRLHRSVVGQQRCGSPHAPVR